MNKADTSETRLESTWSDPGNRLRLAEGFCGHCQAYVMFKRPEQSNCHIVFAVPLESENDHESDFWRITKHHFVLGICSRPSCQKATIVHRVQEEAYYQGEFQGHSRPTDEIIYPISQYSREPLPEAVPEDLRNLYLEAASIERTSPNGTAFLARRILEQALRNHFKTKQKLAFLIDRFLDEENPPQRLHDLMTDIRQFGNIAGHPGQNTDGDWVDIDPSEAEYTLDVVSEVLDYIYVRPARQQAMRDRWQAKKSGEAVDKRSHLKLTLESVPEPQRESQDDVQDQLPF
jgi:hypothetical protein